MSVKLDYYFSMVSPWAFIGHEPFKNIVDKYNITVSYYPITLPKIFENTGGVPLAKRHPARSAYRLLELQRWREKRGLDFPLQPKFWPFDFHLADRIVIAISEAGKDPEPFLRAGFNASWCEGRNMADEGTLANILDSCGFEAESTITAAKADKIGTIYEKNNSRAIEQGYFGSPVYVLNGEMFWGQDRLDMLEDALRTGRSPYKVPGAG